MSAARACCLPRCRWRAAAASKLLWPRPPVGARQCHWRRLHPRPRRCSRNTRRRSRRPGPCPGPSCFRALPSRAARPRAPARSRDLLDLRLLCRRPSLHPWRLCWRWPHPCAAAAAVSKGCVLRCHRRARARAASASPSSRGASCLRGPSVALVRVGARHGTANGTTTTRKAMDTVSCTAAIAWAEIATENGNRHRQHASQR